MRVEVDVLGSPSLIVLNTVDDDDDDDDEVMLNVLIRRLTY